MSGSDSKNEFCQQYESFNKEWVIGKLNDCYQVDKAFHKQVSTQIKYIARKHGLPNDKWNQIYQDLIDESIENNIKLLLAQTMKYSIKKGNIDIEFGKLIEVLQKNHDTEIQSEIVWALGYQIKNSLDKDSKERIDENLVHQINSIIEKTENKLSIESVSFLNQQIQSQYYVNEENYQNITHRKIKMSTHYSKKPIQATVTKHQQTIKIKYKNSESEESVHKLNSVMFFKNLQKKIKVNSNTESLPTIPDIDGSDTSILRDTYEEVAHLYNRIKSGQTLPRKDKDEYLPSKFIGAGKKWRREVIAVSALAIVDPIAAGVVVSIRGIKEIVQSSIDSALESYKKCIKKIVQPLLVDKMIAVIFLGISKKQILHENAINVLMDCIDTLDQVEEKVLGGDTKKKDAAEKIATYNKSKNDSKIIDFLRKPLKMCINDPDIAANMARKIDEERINDSKEIEEILSSEVNQIRLSAISAIYNCAMRNSVILTNERLEKIQQCLDDPNVEFRKFILKLLCIVDKDYKKLFNHCLEQLETGINVDDSIDYIDQQSKDEKRCQELFDDNSITRITSLFEETTLNEKTKIIACTIINNYLGRSYSKGLNEIQLKNYVNLINNPQYGEDLKVEALKSIVLTVEKSKALPNFIIETLVENINKGNDKFDNFVILALGIISERQPILQVDKLSMKLLENWIIVREEVDITFKKSSNDNNDCQSISSIVAQIFLISLQNNVKISDQSLECLFRALNSKDKQTCILSAKSLCLAIETHEINDEILIELKEHIENKINDVSVYSTVVYSRLAKLSSDNKPILASHIQFLPQIYVFEDLKLGEENFTDRVNQNILSVLFNEAENNQFEDDVFQIFNHILLYGNCYQKEAIKILRRHSNKYLIPTDTIFALENVVNISEFSNEVLQVFKNIIYNGQIVSEKILNILADNLYLSDDDQLRKESFLLLDIADSNQDISDYIFDILELERASFSISESLPDANHAILYLREKTKEGQKLTLNCFRALNSVIDEQVPFNEEILRILLNISNNGQMIPNDLIDKIVKKFNPKQEQKYVIEIFENLVKNNQNISSKLLSNLEEALKNVQISDKVLLIFILIGQKGEKLSENIIFKILDQFSSIENPLIIQPYLSVICSVIENNSKSHNLIFHSELISRLQTALIHAIKMDNQDVLQKTVGGFKTLISLHKVQLEKQSIEALLNLTRKNICDQNIKQQINMILDVCELDESQKCILKLCNLKYNSNDQLLDILTEFDKPKLVEQNFDQIDFIIDNCPELNSKALATVLKCSNKEDIPDKLFDSITILLSSTNSPEIRSLCCQIIAETGKFTNEILSTIVARDDKDGLILKSISKNSLIPKEVRDRINLFSQIGRTMSMDIINLQKFLNGIRNELQEDIKLSNQSIEKILSIRIQQNDNSNINIEQELIDIYALILIENPDYCLNSSIVDSLEKAILSETINKNILNAYQEVIKITKCQTNHFSNVLNIFIEILNKNEKYVQFHLDILICITLASEYIDISILEPSAINLSNDDEIIRSWSFRGLRAAYERDHKSEIFQEWCDNIIEKLEENIEIQVDFDLDLFEIITVLKYVDFDKIRDKPQNQWNRELLIFDLVERFKISEGERFQFYQTWLEIEEQETFQKGESDILLKLLHRSLVHNRLSFNQCYDVIKILNRIDFASTHNILSNSKNPCVDLQKKCLTKFIDQRLLNKEDISSKYVDDLTLNMISKFDFHISEKLLYAIEKIDSLRQFEEILNFAKKNQIQISDIFVHSTSVSKLKRSLEIKLLGNKIIRTNRLKLALHLDNLLDKNWTFEQLNTIFNNLEASNSVEKRVKERNFLYVLEILSQYEILPTPKNQEKLLLALMKPVESWLREVNGIAIETNFSEIGEVRNASQLIEELGKSNSYNEDFGINLLNLIERIKSSDLISQVLDNTSEDESDRKKREQSIYITQWTQEQIRQWANTVKTNSHPSINTEDFTVETLAVIKRANYLDTGFHLTDVQILSCLIALNAKSDKGRLLQVATGEGKSTIISVLAVIHALKGKNVDIITSSPVLAKRDSIERTKFYSMFDLQCSDNNDTAIYLKGPKTCYKKQIVYGEAAQFQFDTLRTEYAQLNTLAGRNCNVGIVDEVDSMLIDDSSKIARLATNIAGMDQLQIIYHVLWNEIVSLRDKIIEVNEKFYLLYGKIGFEQGIMYLEYADQQGDIIQILDLKNYISSTIDISHIGQLVSENDEVDVFIKKHLEVYMRKLIEKNIKIPKNFEDFVNKQIPKWIDNAITAFNYQENVHYIVHNGLIKPVDYYSTGIVQSSSNWSDGLHQFLQIKHNLKMTSETFTTNFLSNRGYFTRYGPNLFGLTGTLGSDKAKQVLADVYKVDLVIIPSLRQKQYFSLPDIVVINEIDWLNEICHSAINESRKERGTLVICETIEHTIIIAEKLRQKYRSSAIKLYTMNNMNQEKNVEIINPGEIILATNLAGRGTDIKSDEIEQHGGLHVIVTFMPSNKRVEEQAFGRTARQGKRGTGQRILNAANLIHYENFNIQEITKLRDETEEKMLDDFVKCELKVITLKDELFVKFCSLLNKIRQSIREKTDLSIKLKNKIKNVFINVTSVFESNVLLSIEEQWAMFLRKIDDQKDSIDIEGVRKKYEEFSKSIEEDYKKDRVIKNPYYHIVIGNDLVINDFSLNSKYDQATKHFDRAIELDPEHSAAAFVGKGWVLLKGKEKFFRSNKQNLGYKETAIRMFHKALLILSEEMALIISVQTLLQQRSSHIHTALSKQLIQKVNILGTYCNSIENVITVVKKSQRLMQITEIRACTSNSGVSKQIISYDGIEKGSGKWCDIRLISDDHRKHREAIENIKEIGIIKKDENQFTIIYKHKEKNKLVEYIVDDQKLNDYLLPLHYNETILDRDNYSNIYNLIYQKIKSNNGFIREDFLIPIKDLTDNNEYEITFNDLTVRQDSGTIDQAIETIDHAVPDSEQNSLPEEILRSTVQPASKLPEKNPFLTSDYEDISVSINQINAEILKTFLNPDIEIKETTKEGAISQLKDKSSFFHHHLLPESFSPDSCQVDLEIIFDNKELEEISGLQARDAIDTIQQQKEDTAHFNLTFKSANEISTVLTKQVAPLSDQTVEFIGLNGENVKEKLANIESKNIMLEISDSKEKLIEVIKSPETEYIELNSDKNEEKNNIKEIVDKATAERKIKNIKRNNATIRVMDLNKSTVEKIISICPNANFNINFIGIEFTSLLKGLKDESVSIHFDKLKKEVAKTLITQIRKQNLDFSLTFKNLKSYQAQRLIEVAPIEQENIEINKVKTLSELFMNESRPDLELSEFSARGIEYLLEISEKRFVPWRSIAVVVAIVAVQMAVGGVLIATGFGATVGMGLITEGGADLFTAYRAYSTRQFSWSDYGKQKAVSLVISAVSMGFSAIKDAGKGIQTIATSVGEEVLEQAGTKVITDGKAVGQVLTTTGKNLKSLAVKQIGVTVGENTVREGLNKVADLSSHFVLEQWKPQVSASIQNKVSCKFSEPNLRKIVRKMYAIDSFNKQQQLKGKINKIVAEIINPEHNFWREQWDSIGGPLCKGILSSVDRIRGPASMGIRILGTLNGMYQITFIIDNVHDELLTKLSQIHQETLSMNQLLHRYCQVSKEDTNDIVSLLREQGISDLNEELDDEKFSTKISRADFVRFDMYKETIVKFLTSLHTNMLSVECNDFSEIMKLVSDMITEQIFRITESQLISPWSSYGMGELTKAISERVQHHFIVDEKQNSDSQNRENQENGGGKYNTIAKQINYNARDYTIAYSQCECVHYSQQKDRTNHGEIDKETKEYAEKVRNDQPANLADMIALAAKNDLDIKLVDEIYRLTEKDIEAKNICVHTKGQKDNHGNDGIGHIELVSSNDAIGHIELMSSNDATTKISKGKNDCGYAVIQRLLKDRGIEKSIDDLRNERAQMIEDNPKQFSKALKAQRWIETRYPQEANSLLMVGAGKKKQSSSNKRSTTEEEPDRNLYEDTEYENMKLKTKYKKGGEILPCNKSFKEEALRVGTDKNNWGLLQHFFKNVPGDDKFAVRYEDGEKAKTIVKTTNMRLDNQGGMGKTDRYLNYQIQLNQQGKSTISHVLIAKPTDPDTTFSFTKDDIQKAFEMSFEKRKTVILEFSPTKQKEQ